MSNVIAVGDVPGVLFLPQTNGFNHIAGPFMNSIPTLPAGWMGSGSSYRYSLIAGGMFVACATGDGTAANSSGGNTCP
jgi:hypothetical protein